MEELDEYELEYEYLNRIMEFPENLLFFPNIEEPDITQINNIEEMDINQHYYLMIQVFILYLLTNLVITHLIFAFPHLLMKLFKYLIKEEEKNVFTISFQ